jgi:hypothetical protein
VRIRLQDAVPERGCEQIIRSKQQNGPRKSATPSQNAGSPDQARDVSSKAAIIGLLVLEKMRRTRPKLLISAQFPPERPLASALRQTEIGKE